MNILGLCREGIARASGVRFVHDDGGREAAGFKGEEALQMVDPARQLARQLDAWSDFDAFGTASVAAGAWPVGRLNSRLWCSVARQGTLRGTK